MNRVNVFRRHAFLPYRQDFQSNFCKIKLLVEIEERHGAHDGRVQIFRGCYKFQIFFIVLYTAHFVCMLLQIHIYYDKTYTILLTASNLF